jgi:hypothetical protein
MAQAFHKEPFVTNANAFVLDTRPMGDSSNFGCAPGEVVLNPSGGFGGEAELRIGEEDKQLQGPCRGYYRLLSRPGANSNFGNG